ncbi:unnamed protein product [Linum tenue]|uniref:C2H2-type domain-containing protein n=2 Tax=Linum tenue TaxID=586396 RepID=A0AAV0P2S4_9ROSI|nr:unnamed protein product [Linum tenue]
MPQLFSAVEASHLLKPPLFLPQTALYFSYSLAPSNPNRLFNGLTLTSRPPPPHVSTPHRRCSITACSSASNSEINMVKNRQGIYTAKQNKVVVLWDLDNKPPRGPPYHAALSLKEVASKFGDVVEMSAYANRHAFVHLPQWVAQERRERRQQDILERKGIVAAPEPYICGVCGRKCKTNLDLKKHFRQLHERERQKKVNRMRSLKGKKRQRYKERFISGNDKYNDEARRLVTPKVGYGLAAELRRAGVYVKTVEDKPQAADWAVKRQIEHSMSRGIDWLVLVSDDSDFGAILKRAREANLGTVVVGDRDRALGRHADLWVPWIGVENGEVTEKDLVPKRRGNSSEEELEYDVRDSFSHSDGEEWTGDDVDSVVEEIAAEISGYNSMRISVFSEGEEEEEDGDYVLWDSDDDEIEDQGVSFYL